MLAVLLHGEEARRGRKMGHLTLVAPSLPEAQAKLRSACDILGIGLDA